MAIFFFLKKVKHHYKLLKVLTPLKHVKICCFQNVKYVLKFKEQHQNGMQQTEQYCTQCFQSSKRISKICTVQYNYL